MNFGTNRGENEEIKQEKDMDDDEEIAVISSIRYVTGTVELELYEY